MLGDNLEFLGRWLGISVEAFLQSDVQRRLQFRSLETFQSRRRQIDDIVEGQIQESVLQLRSFHLFRLLDDFSSEQFEIRLQAHDVGKTEHQIFESRDGRLRHVRVDGREDIGDVGLRESSLDSLVLELFGEAFQIVENRRGRSLDGYEIELPDRLGNAYSDGGLRTIEFLFNRGTTWTCLVIV